MFHLAPTSRGLRTSDTSPFGHFSDDIRSQRGHLFRESDVEAPSPLYHPQDARTDAIHGLGVAQKRHAYTHNSADYSSQDGYLLPWSTPAAAASRPARAGSPGFL